MPPRGKRKLISISTKKEIIEKYEKGMRMVDLAREYVLAVSTVDTIVKNKAKFKKAIVAGVTSRICVGRELISEMENLLLVWIREKQMKGDTLPGAYICERAKQIFDDLKKNSPSTSVTKFSDFKASKGWFDRFRKRVDIKSVLRHGQKNANTNKGAANEFKIEFANFVKEEDLTTEELQQLGESCEQDSGEEEKPEDEHIVSSEDIANLFDAWETVRRVIAYHPDIEGTELAACNFEDKALNYFRTLQRKMHLDTFFTRSSPKQ